MTKSTTVAVGATVALSRLMALCDRNVWMKLMVTLSDTMTTMMAVDELADDRGDDTREQQNDNERIGELPEELDDVRAMLLRGELVGAALGEPERRIRHARRVRSRVP
jgi:hypothetical protein